jgi:hypothetical protein
MELIPKAEFSIVTRANKAWIPELIAAAGPEVTETYIDFFTATIRNRKLGLLTHGLAGSFLTGAPLMAWNSRPYGRFMLLPGLRTFRDRNPQLS